MDIFATFENVPEKPFASILRGERDDEGFRRIEDSNFENLELFEEAVLGQARLLLNMLEKGLSCSKECSQKAITARLGAEVGGSKRGKGDGGDRDEKDIEEIQGEVDIGGARN